ncbi:hypothetical protein J7T55_012611 [Diaporthe amygdali]|uniref:uncharacterized protein n=1 Tax=Phomopsis amygdali TaxID=1214568 RepID=UPI0022FE4857|nr:uncharacterized protein J7T55_012611 [Diaporthe amygdali]KAJ0115334.1 hypothetical protein J7T55_012611 [Diaporthe amygdali]
MSETCISLQGSTACPAFQSSSISTDSTLVGFFSFLQFVSDRASFDAQLESYVQTTYVQDKYQTLFGCGNIELTNTSNLYARFTTSVICNAIVQNSINPCGLSSSQSQPLCADTCSEAYYVSDSQLCSNPSSGATTQIRADFTNCALPADSLSSDNCIDGIQNEPDNCGYGNSTIGLCSYCASGGTNSTDTCCYNSNAENRCANVTLPSITSTITLPTSTSSPSPSSTAGAGRGGLSGGAIAGIVIGSAAQARQSIREHIQPALTGKKRPHVPGWPHCFDTAWIRSLAWRAAAVGAVRSRRVENHSSSSEFGDSPESEPRAGVLRPPPTSMLKRTGSLSSGSVLLAGEDAGSNGMSSPQGVASQQSEQLPYFKDYYSQDEIHPGDRVAVLWAYQPRAADEFALERGDMLKVVGIWDDGWATGVMVDERAEDWEARRQQQRDSGVSNTSGRGRDLSPPASGEIKAFPLVCVCLPEHWRKTIESDTSTEAASSAHQR